MSSLLVTGGAGFIGSHFVDHWLAHHAADRIVVLDLLTYAGNLRNLEPARANPRFRFVHGDIRDGALVERLMREEQVDTIVNFAAETHVDRSIADASAFLSTNVLGTHELLCAARKVWLEGGAGTAHRFHHVSTDEVYGSLAADEPPWEEGTAYAPNSPYAASKAAADHLVRAWARTYGLHVTISNCSNNYGPRQYPEKLIPLTIASVLAGRRIPVYGDGRNLREWLHVEDHCRGIELVLERGRAGEVYHLGGGESSANIDLVRRICALLDDAFARDSTLAGRYSEAPPARGNRSDSLVEFVADRPGHDRRYAVNGAKARSQLGFDPGTPLTLGLGRTIDWYLGHGQWWAERD